MPSPHAARRLPRLVFALLALASLAVLRPSHAAPSDPAARGLDLFVHAPSVVAPGGVLPVAIEAIGFASVVSPAALPGAVVEAAWDPETLGKVSRVPPPVRATTDAQGRAHLDVPVPDDDGGDLQLLLGVRSGVHTRTRTLKVQRERLIYAELYVPDTHVVPGSTISAWVRVASVRSGAPVAGAATHVTLVEGGVPRFETKVATDASGSAMVRVPIPRTDDPAWKWTLTAQAFAGAGHTSPLQQIDLVPREETPGKPTLRAAWNEAAVQAGDRASYRIDVRDATGQPVADQSVRYWIGPKGTTPPGDADGWQAASTRAITDAAGEVTGGTDTPSTVVQGVGTTVTIVVKTNVDGHDLDASATVQVGVGAAWAAIYPEARDIVPGVAQRLLLRVIDGRGQPISAPFLVEGDGLREEVRTDAHGEAELSWKAPPDVGAARNVGPCAGGVAASVRVRAMADVPQILPRRDPFDLCLTVDRDAAGIVRADRSAARVGDTVHVSIAPAQPSVEAKDKTVARGPWSVVVQASDGHIVGGTATGAWMEDGEKGIDVTLPEGMVGPWEISAAMPGLRRSARVLGTSILVAPRVLPRLSAKVVGGRAAPGGEVDVDVALTDEKGGPLVGSVAALMIDARGGGSTAGIEWLDTRRNLCRAFSVEEARCDRIVEGDPALDMVRRADLAQPTGRALAPALDPGAVVVEALRRAFASVVLSLEGAVHDAAQSPDRLRDVRRKVGSTWQFNPELMTLVTAAMPAPPETPGGEPLALGDLIAIDPQVTFDNVARRIARAKMFRILAAVRQFRHEHYLDPDEPALGRPNALLRRLVRESRLSEQDLVDPWGGTIQFTKSAGPSVPFLSAVKGFELHAPGPDGVAGSGDDVRDPFERVLRSGTPYALAVEEDRVVDAKLEMEVGDATVSAWEQLFAGLFGKTLGDSFGSGGLGLTGVGEGGGGRGEGIGLGRIGTVGHGRGTFGVDTGVAFWSPAQRTDASGKLRLHVPLRDIETTWRLALVGVPDGGLPAATAIEIPAALPLSARVDAGAVWALGDEASVAITVRNRQVLPVRAALAITAGGAVSIAEPTGTGAALAREVVVPAEGAAVVRARVKATRSGTAEVAVRLVAQGAPEDLVTHRWEVRPPAEPTDFTSARWVEDQAELSLTMPPASIRLAGAPRLVIERGWELSLAGALGSLDPDDQTSPRALADTLEVASRLRRWAIARGGEKDPIAERAADFARRATGRLVAYAALDGASARAPLARARPYAPIEIAAGLGAPGQCPGPGGSLDTRLELVDAEPEAQNGTTKPCWDVFVAETAEAVQASGDPEALARLFLAVVERGHRQVLAASLADRLRDKLAVQPSGALKVADDLAARRATRAILFAALLRAVHVGRPGLADAARFAAWIGVQRDAQGGYGSTLATRLVVRALVAEGPRSAETSHVVVEGAGPAQTLDVPPVARLVVPLPADAARVTVRVTGPGVVARFERPVLRLWSAPPSDAASPLHVEAIWPDEPRAGKTGTLIVRLRQTTGEAITADVTLPLPPGVTLAEGVNGVRQVQGVLSIRRAVDASTAPTVIEIPLAFALPGKLTVPEARARVAFEDLPRAIAPARPILVSTSPPNPHGR